jgi:UDP-2-acetamido-3-amino-2,3-dideoxy-glucuronate N-acetyltransferase
MRHFVHPQGICESDSVGAGTNVWAFAHVLPGAVIGKNCNICDHVFVENDVVLGDRVTVKCGVQLWDGLRAGNDVFIGPNVTFTNDPFPKSKQRPAEFAKTTLEEGCSIGAKATIPPGISIGRNRGSCYAISTSKRNSARESRSHPGLRFPDIQAS